MSDSNKALKEKLLSSRKNGFDRVDAAELEQMEAYCKEYMAFLDAGKTERLCAAETVRLAEQAGYKPLVRGQALKAGDKVYVCNRGKSVLLAHVGSKPMSEGTQIAAAHIDSPRRHPQISVGDHPDGASRRGGADGWHHCHSEHRRR